MRFEHFKIYILTLVGYTNFCRSQKSNLFNQKETLTQCNLTLILDKINIDYVKV